MMGEGHASAAVIVEVHRGTGQPTSPWQPGPAPMPLPGSGGSSDYVYSAAADATTRGDVLRPQVAPILYGTDRVKRRWYLQTVDTTLMGHEVTWLEILDLPVGGKAAAAFLVIHLDLGAVTAPELASITASLGNVRDVPHSARAAVKDLLAQVLPTARVAAPRTAYVVTHWVPEQLPDSPLEGLSKEVGWSRVIAASNSAAMTSSSLRKEQTVEEILLSRSWLACVLNSGTCFLGVSGPSDSYHELGRVLAHTVYLDALLLALLQDYGIDHLAREVGNVWEVNQPLRVVGAMERTALRFRGQAWWTNISPTIHANKLLHALQSQRELEQAEARLRSDIDDIVAYTAARRADRTNALLALFVVAGFGVGGAALIADPGRVAILWGMWLTLLAGVLLIAFQKRGGKW